MNLPLAAQTPDNWRERCRQIISGQYLEYYDTHFQAVSQADILNRQILEMSKNLAANRAEYEKLNEKNKSDEFDKNQALALQNIRAKVKLGEDILSVKREALTGAQKSAEMAKARLERFTKLTDPVFLIHRAPPKDADPGYGIRLEFRSPCPKHRYVCPLPAKEASALAEIAKTIEAGEFCKRYANVQR